MPCKGVWFPSPTFCCIAAPACTEGSPTTCAPRNWAMGDFTPLKAFSKQIWTCSEPSSSTHKSCQACWPACTVVVTTKPWLLDPSWPVSNQPRMGRNPAQVALSQAIETQPGQALPVSLCSQPRFPWGLSLLRKKDAFNNVQPIFYNFNVLKFIFIHRLRSLSPDVNTPYVSLSLRVRFRRSSIY